MTELNVIFENANVEHNFDGTHKIPGSLVFYTPEPPVYTSPPIPADPAIWGTVTPRLPRFVIDPYADPGFDYGNGIVGKWERAEICGMRGQMQVPYVPVVDGVSQNLRFYFEYQGLGDGVSDKVAQIALWYKTFAHNADVVNDPPLGSGKLFIICSIPQNNPGSKVLSAYADIPAAHLADNCTVKIYALVRDTGLVGDTFLGDTYISAQKIIFAAPAS